MNIKTVSYKQLVSFGNYENASVGATATVAEGEDPEDVLAAVKEWVQGQLGQRGGLRILAHDVEALVQRKALLQTEVERDEKKMLEGKAFLEKHGVSSGPFFEDLPF